MIAQPNYKHVAEDQFIVEISEDTFTVKYRDLELYKTLSLNPQVKMVEPHSIERTKGKAKRVIDIRDK